jgi:hypothetical protein
MDRRTTTPRRRDVIITTLLATGFDPLDFEVEETAKPSLGELQLTDSVLAVRRRSTGDERLYMAGDEMPWFALLEDDLQQGRFGVGRRNG